MAILERLTPLSRALIGIAVIAAIASTVWHLVLKDMWANWATPEPAASTSVTTTPAQSTAIQPTTTPVATQPVPTPVPTPPPATTPVQPIPANTADTPPPVAAKAAPANHLSAAENGELGRKALDKGDFAQARSYLELAVQGGDGAAACHLGEMVLKGQGGIAANQDKAASLFQLAQAKGIICFASSR